MRGDMSGVASVLVIFTPLTRPQKLGTARFRSKPCSRQPNVYYAVSLLRRILVIYQRQRASC